MAGSAHAVAELCDIDNEELVHMIGQEKVETVVAHDLIGRSMIQCGRQPGLGQVMSALLGFEGMEFYTAPTPEILVGKTFAEVTLRFADAIPLGISRCSRPGWCRRRRIQHTHTRVCVCVCVTHTHTLSLSLSVSHSLTLSPPLSLHVTAPFMPRHWLHSAKRDLSELHGCGRGCDWLGRCYLGQAPIRKSRSIRQGILCCRGGTAWLF
eukprot:COSAG05_NODE_890_length_6734_cov_2.541824_6_plen_209_part_00